MSIHMHPQVPPPGSEAPCSPASSSSRRPPAARLTSDAQSTDGSRDSFDSCLPSRTQDKLRRFGQNTLGVCGLLAACCLMPCSKRA